MQPIPNIMTEIIQTNDFCYFNKIKSLYIETFSHGQSKQFIDQEELNTYLNDIFNHGYLIIAHTEDQLTGALLCLPLSHDASFPSSLSKMYNVEKSVYIAELMVAEKHRGQQVGKNLLTRFMETVDPDKFNHIFIRVWKKNSIALNLYKNAGFEEVAEIIQTKQTPDKTETFKMHKAYLQKTTN